MGLVSKFKNLSKVTGKLRKRKYKRAKEIIRDYGLREFLRRVGEKMQYGDAAVQTYERLYVVTNESFLAKNASLKPFRCEQRVRFSTAPGGFSVGRVEILTCNPEGTGSVTMRIFDKGELRAACTVPHVEHGAYTGFDFMPVIEVTHKPLDFEFTSDTPGCGVMVNRRRSKHGFTVEGGGCVAARVYTQLDALYTHWLANNTPTEAELGEQRSTMFAYTPKISVIVPLYNTPEGYLRDMIDSVVAQTYANWELCLADGSTDGGDLKQVVDSYGDSRIKYKKLDKNEGISGNSNRAIEMATGEFIALLDHDDTLAPQALFKNVQLLNEDRDLEFIYSDEDKITMNGKRRFDPFFKPDFSPNMLMAFNYITHLVVAKKSLLDEVGWFDDKFNGAQDYDLVLRATEKAKKVGHIPDVLYNWRAAETSTAFSSDTKSYTVQAGKAALEAAIARRGIAARVEENSVLTNYYTVKYDLPQPPPGITIIIPNRDEAGTLKKCVDSILKKSTYANYKILVVENNSTQKATFSYYETLKADPRVDVVVWDEKEFNYSRINNFAVEHTQSPLLLFLNNDITVITPDWLEQMAMHAQRPEIGAVGAKLYYPDDTLQHGGVIFQLGGCAGHSHKGTERDEVGALGRLVVTHDLSGVTAACLMTRRDVFDQVGGFDETFVLAFGDVDLCLKIRQAGYSIVWTPFAELYHHESKTRGYEDTDEKQARFMREYLIVNDKWAGSVPIDPFYNPNLTHAKEDYSIDPGKTGATLEKERADRAGKRAKFVEQHGEDALKP